MTRRICLGKIATAHGVRGLVKLHVYGDDPHSFEKYGALYTAETGSDTLTLRLKGRAGGQWLAQVDGVDDRNAAETLRGKQLWLDRDKLPPPADNEFYHVDLIGLAVHDESGARIGSVIGVENFGAGDLLDIRPDIGESFYLSFTKDNIRSIDLAAKKIIASMLDSIAGDDENEETDEANA